LPHCARRWEERELPHHSWTKFIDAKRKELQRLNNAYKNTLSNAKVELLQGFGKILDAHTVDVDGTKYTVSDLHSKRIDRLAPLAHVLGSALLLP
jgi:pyruvate/2-oxoglutarate dehydrogenase complex dihydrolipoamide dehydrogenase (E3) component